MGTENKASDSIESPDPAIQLRDEVTSILSIVSSYEGIDRRNFNLSDSPNNLRWDFLDYALDRDMSDTRGLRILEDMTTNPEGRSIIFSLAMLPEAIQLIFKSKIDPIVLREYIHASFREILLPLEKEAEEKLQSIRELTMAVDELSKKSDS